MSEQDQATGGTGSRADGGTGGRRRRRLDIGHRVRQRRATSFRPSRFVMTLKFLLPAAAVAILSLVVLWPRLQETEDPFRLDVTAIGPTGNAKPQVLNPRLTGVDENSQPFQITADIGSTVIAEDGREIYHLEQPKADISMDDGTWMALMASDGIFEPDEKILTLRNGVSLFHDSGAQFVTETARIDMDDRSAFGDDQVEGHGPFGELTSEGFRVVNGGGTIIFTGKARLVLAKTSVPGNGGPAR